MNRLKQTLRRAVSFFRRGHDRPASPLRIEGIPDAPLTPEPDDAELAARALLESLAGHPAKAGEADGPSPEQGTAEYYRRLADRIRQAHDAATLRTMRFVSFCEQELQKPALPVTGPGSLALLEAELYKRIDTVDREGGDLRHRWQHCLAEVTVRLMQASRADSGDPED